jgi:hypothetical protein
MSWRAHTGLRGTSMAAPGPPTVRSTVGKLADFDMQHQQPPVLCQRSSRFGLLGGGGRVRG